VHSHARCRHACNRRAHRRQLHRAPRPLTSSSPDPSARRPNKLEVTRLCDRSGHRTTGPTCNAGRTDADHARRASDTAATVDEKGLACAAVRECHPTDGAERPFAPLGKLDASAWTSLIGSSAQLLVGGAAAALIEPNRPGRPIHERKDRPCDGHEQQQQADRGEERGGLPHRAFRDTKG